MFRFGSSLSLSFKSIYDGGFFFYEFDMFNMIKAVDDGFIRCEKNPETSVVVHLSRETI